MPQLCHVMCADSASRRRRDTLTVFHQQRVKKARKGGWSFLSFTSFEFADRDKAAMHLQARPWRSHGQFALRETTLRLKNKYIDRWSSDHDRCIHCSAAVRFTPKWRHFRALPLIGVARMPTIQPLISENAMSSELRGKSLIPLPVRCVLTALCFRPSVGN